MPGLPDREAGGSVLPKKLTEAHGDVDPPDVREVGSGIKGDAKGGQYPEGPGYRKGAELQGEDGGGKAGDDGLR
jgi:hypothetical protein